MQEFNIEKKYQNSTGIFSAFAIGLFWLQNASTTTTSKNIVFSLSSNFSSFAISTHSLVPFPQCRSRTVRLEDLNVVRAWRKLWEGVQDISTHSVRQHWVFNWSMFAGRSWGCDGSGCGIGRGAQEQYYGCADIAILRSCEHFNWPEIFIIV